MEIQEPRRSSRLFTILGLIMGIYSALLVLATLLTVMNFKIAFSIKLFVFLIGTPVIVATAVISIGFLRARIPRPFEEVYKEYETVLKEVKKIVGEEN